MRHAFHEDRGPLTDMQTEKSDAKHDLIFLPVRIGSFKNALSHRDANIDDPAMRH